MEYTQKGVIRVNKAAFFNKKTHLKAVDTTGHTKNNYCHKTFLYYE